MKTEPEPRPSASLSLIFVLLIVAIVLVRVVALDADAPNFLSWSAGLYSDEGFYTNDSRSVALFHHWSVGDFHSAILSPVLYGVQLLVFRCFGAGLVQARLISVVLGLLTILFLSFGLRRLYGTQTALAGALFLGLSAPFAFYNRLALMETPAVFCLALAFYWYTIPKNAFWAGMALGMSGIIKPTAFFVLPSFLFHEARRALMILAGIALPLAAYLAFWYIPHHAVISKMSRYYALHQYLPHSLVGLAHNLRRGIATGAGDGILPYLVHFAPVLLALAIAGVVVACIERREGDLALVLWLFFPIAIFLLFSYTPSRYYVLFWPALAGLAARGLVGTAASARASAGFARAFVVVAIAAFLFTNGWLFASAWMGRAYSLRDGGYTLARVLPTGSVLAGQMAPSLCLSNRLPALMAQPGLANDTSPVERYDVSYILVTRSIYWNTWWKKAYPPIITPDRRIMTLKLGNSYLVDVYRVR